MHGSFDVLRKGNDEKIMLDIAEIKAKRVKTTILSGFLGAGKTTLLNYIIRQNQDTKIAILVNDFGEINIDSDLIVSRDENKLDLTGGCICCTIQKDLLRGVVKLMKQSEKPDHIIVECSGAADPSQVLNTLSSPLFKFHLHVDGLFTVVDCSQLLKIGKEHLELAERQIKPSNLLILNKIDLIDRQTLNQVKAFIKKISPKAVMLEAIQCQVPLELVFGFKEPTVLIDKGPVEKIAVHARKSRGQGKPVSILPAVPKHQNGRHDSVFESWSFRSDTPLIKKAFKNLLTNIPPEIIRAKGFVYWDDSKNPLVLLNLVGQWIDIDVHFKKEALSMETKLVFIGKPGWKKRYDIESHFYGCMTKNR